MGMDQAAPGIFDLELVIAEVLGNGVLQLPENRNGLHQAGGAHRMPTRLKTNRRIDRQSALKGRMALVNETTAFSVFA